ncbi:MAG: gamma-glutamyl-gamma-aminobutyrate hydrolase [Euryarchaeota archaeon]|nr:gamma-glutamyl-gamma-aminobutyrate hydrolase [Euryarchaeota archaeon]OUW22846.1 MAG: hypothetical protein CBD33_00740 [Euryarchaeota archaeon TMED173]|tara:strand:- start:695 stop:1384 length:690 start_codon:yes stop_codon:yes gene_type:complete
MRPVIGITCSMRNASYGAWNNHAAILPSDYLLKIDEAGGRPLIIPPVGDMTEIMSQIDGLIISGGPDIDPANYSQDPDEQTTDFDRNQDETEIGLIRYALEKDIPILGICRGMQILSVAHGGHLHQHLDTTPGYEKHGGYYGNTSNHGVNVVRGSRLEQIMGDQIQVNSAHHQGVANPGSLKVSAIADHDGLIEAVEREDKLFCIGVQWHPERKDHHVLFSALIEAARG